VPWAEPWAATEPERAELAASFGAAIRRTGSLMQLMNQAAADRIGINPTDLNCLNILSFRGQMTAGELARVTGLTTASITGVVDRLEEAGFVRRERDPRDRRRVVIRLVLETALRDVASVFLPMMRDWQQMAARYSDEELRLIVDFYDRMEEVLREHLTRLRGAGGIPANRPGARWADGKAPLVRGEGPGAPWLEWPASGLGCTLAQRRLARGAEFPEGGFRLADLRARGGHGPQGTALARQSTWPGRA
jgi:DNA-binding MarR family transcriptional regulator